jgi:hypothetical protein
LTIETPCWWRDVDLADVPAVGEEDVCELAESYVVEFGVRRDCHEKVRPEIPILTIEVPTIEEIDVSGESHLYLTSNVCSNQRGDSLDMLEGIENGLKTAKGRIPRLRSPPDSLPEGNES